MAETKYTTKRGFPYPTGVDFVEEGPENFESLAAKADTLNEGQGDFLQPGIVLSSDWSFTAAMESESEAKIESTTTTGGTCWFEDSTIGLLRSSTAVAKLKALKPSSLPASGKYMCVGIELAPNKWGEAATASVVSGAEKTTQAEAESHSPAVTAGRGRIRDVILLNNGGTKYELIAQRDRRPWARGAFSNRSGSGAINSTTYKEQFGLTQRVEISSALWVRLTLTTGEVTVSGSPAPWAFRVQQTVGATTTTLWEETGITSPSTALAARSVVTYAEASAGSALLVPEFKNTSTGEIEINNVSFTVEEMKRAPFYNGTG